MKRIGETRGRKPIIVGDRLERMKALLEAGESQRVIARHLGVSRGAVVNAIDRLEWAEAAE